MKDIQEASATKNLAHPSNYALAIFGEELVEWHGIFCAVVVYKVNRVSVRVPGCKAALAKMVAVQRDRKFSAEDLFSTSPEEDANNKSM